jgi:threonine dehydratase
MTALPVTLQDVQAAAARIKGAVVRTPCLRSETLSRIAKADIWLKFEKTCNSPPPSRSAAR